MGSDFGIKLAQPGHDVTTAGDQELLFSSSWPVLKIIYEGVFSGLSSDNPLILVSHNLGYVPAFVAYLPGSTYVLGGVNVSADTKNIYWHPGGGGKAPFTVQVAIIVFDLNIEQNFVAPQIQVSTSAQAHGDDNFGIKLTKEGKDISSSDLRDYIIHSSSRGPMVHAVVNGLGNAKGPVGTTKNFVYTHDLPYNPMFFAYMQVSDDKYFLVSTFAAIKTSGNQISIIAINSDKKASIVVLKDPFQIADNNLKIS